MLNYQSNPALFWVLGMYEMYKNNTMPAFCYLLMCVSMGSCGSLSPGVLTPTFSWYSWMLPHPGESMTLPAVYPPCSAFGCCFPSLRKALSPDVCGLPSGLDVAISEASDPRPEISSNSGPKHRANGARV